MAYLYAIIYLLTLLKSRLHRRINIISHPAGYYYFRNTVQETGTIFTSVFTCTNGVQRLWEYPYIYINQYW